MKELITFKVLPSDRGWKVMRDEQLVAHYPNQTIAEKAAARQARAEANKGNQARAILHKRDGTVSSERSYTKLTTPWVRPKLR
jgi:hypothetical protein